MVLANELPTGDFVVKSFKHMLGYVLMLFVPVYAFFLVLYSILLSFGESSFLVTSGVYSSDLVQPYLIAQDFLRNPTLLDYWNFSPALYVFPDLIFSLLISTLHVPGIFLPVCYGALMLTTYTFAIAYCINGCVPDRGRRTAWVVGACLTLFSICAVFFGGSLSKSVFFWLPSAFIHTGALLTTIFSMGLYMRMLEAGTRREHVCFEILVLLISFSDLIFVEWFVIPSFFVAFIIYLIQKRLDGIRLSERLLLAALSGVILEILVRRGAVLKSYLASCNTNMGMFVDIYSRITAGDLGLALIVILNLGLTIQAVSILVRSIATGSMEKKEILVLFLAASSLIAFVFMVFLGVYGCYLDAVMFRYMLPVFVNPFIWLVVVVCTILNRRRVRLIVYLSFTAIVSGMLFAKQLPNIRERFIANNQSPLLQCLIEHRLTQGYADYMNAKRHMFLSNGHVHLMQIDDEINPMLSNYNSAWFLVDRISLMPLHPNFILVDHLNIDAITNKFGPPTNTIECEGHLLYVYKKGLPLILVTAKNTALSSF